MELLLNKFQAICSSNGDDTAIHVTSISHPQTDNNTLTSKATLSPNQTGKNCVSANSSRKRTPYSLNTSSIGFSELNENCNLIASELYNRHNIIDAYYLDHKDIKISNPEQCGDDCEVPCCSGGVVILSSQPSPGEITSILACTKLCVPFIPLSSIHSHQRRMSQSQSRMKTILDETKPHVAILVLSIKESFYEQGEWNETRPAFNNDDSDDIIYYIDEFNDTVRILNECGIHRIIVVNAKDGSMIGSSIYHDHGSDCEGIDFNTFLRTKVYPSITKETSEGGHCKYNDIAYILYTSGSTNSNKPKAVVQTYKGIYNRIQWQWKTFPFIQQHKRKYGYQTTLKLIEQDGIHYYGEGDIVMRRTPLAFVDSVAEIYGTLLAGVPLWCPLYHYDVDKSNIYNKGNGRTMNNPSITVLSIKEMLEIASQSNMKITRLTCLPSQLVQTLNFIHDAESGSRSEYDENPNKSSGDDTKRVKQFQISRQHWIHNLNAVIVSGEPCPMSLIEDFERTFIYHRAILVNLYGQTESSGDVSCMIVGIGGNVKSEKKQESESDQSVIARFPNAHEYVWKEREAIVNEKTKTFNATRDNKDIHVKKEDLKKDYLKHRLVQILVPCGLPIDGHKFFIVKKKESDDLGCLHVEGVGIALGYLNNPIETRKNFDIVENKRRSHEESNSMHLNGEIQRFNTMDLAFMEKDLLYIVGRAPQGNEETSDNLTSLTMGKINGVAIHVNEIETPFCNALKSILEEELGISNGNNGDFNIHAVGAIFNINDEHKQTTSKSVMFVDQSFFQSYVLETTSTSSCRIMNSSEVRLKSSNKSIREAFVGARSLMASNDVNSYTCHPSLIPHHIFLVSTFPCNGVAGKIDRKALVTMAKENFYNENTKRKFMSDRNGNLMKDQMETAKFTVQDIIQVYNETLNIEIDKNLIDTATFVELGGDSMIAIDAAHRIVKIARSYDNQALKAGDHMISGPDLFQYSIKDIHDIIVLGRHLVSEKQSKRIRLSDNVKPNQDESFTFRLGDLSIFNSTNQSDNKLAALWKLPLLMCVDARPTIITLNINKSSTSLVAVGSQGGDFVLANSVSGKILTRKRVNGKIEGQINYICPQFKEESNFKCIIYVPCYNTIPATSQDDTSRNGYIHAFELKINTQGSACNNIEDVYSLTELWVYQVQGEIKNKPISISIPNHQHHQMQAVHRIVVASYDGSVSYLNAITGETLFKFSGSDMGGAIHADPIASIVGNRVRVLVASSTWVGKVSCLIVQKDSLMIDWQIDIGTPIYSTPLFIHEDIVIVFGIDGSIRSLNLYNGNENWVKSVASRPIFSSGIYIQLLDMEVIVFGCHDGFVRCVNLVNCELKWKFDTKSAILGTPLPVNHQKNIIITTTSGRVFSLKANSGFEDKMPIQLKGEIFSSPTFSSREPPSVVIGCRDSHLYSIKVN